MVSIDLKQYADDALNTSFYTDNNAIIKMFALPPTKFNLCCENQS